MSSRRVERVAEAIREEVSRIILADLSDPRLGFVTVLRVQVTPDVREARVHVSILGDEGARNRTMHALIHARGHIQEQLGEKLELRYTPRLWFVDDGTVRQDIRISRIITDLHDKGELPPLPPPEPPRGGARPGGPAAAGPEAGAAPAGEAEGPGAGEPDGEADEAAEKDEPDDA